MICLFVILEKKPTFHCISGTWKWFLLTTTNHLVAEISCVLRICSKKEKKKKKKKRNVKLRYFFLSTGVIWLSYSYLVTINTNMKYFLSFFSYLNGFWEAIHRNYVLLNWPDVSLNPILITCNKFLERNHKVNSIYLI